MALSAEQIVVLKYVDKQTDMVVHGYIHKTHEDFPLPLIQMVILFYFLAESFDIHPPEIQICGEQKERMKKKDGESAEWNNMTFGAFSVASMSSYIARWTFKMVKNNLNDNGIALGVVASKDATQANVHHDCENPGMIGYFYASSRHIFACGKPRGNYGSELGGVGTKITMELNLSTAELIFYKNDKSLGVACENIQKGWDIEYKMAVTLYWPGAELSLLSFECQSAQI